MARRLKCLPAMQETWVRSLGWEDPLEKEMATHSSILAWRIPWAEEPGGLQSTGSQRVGHNWATSLHLSISKVFFLSWKHIISILYQCDFYWLHSLLMNLQGSCSCSLLLNDTAVEVFVSLVCFPSHLFLEMSLMGQRVWTVLKFSGLKCEHFKVHQ